MIRVWSRCYWSRKTYSRCACRKAQIEAAFKECDTDNDGFISAAELNVVMSKKGQSMSEAEAVIAKYDINGDGKLDYQEFAAYYDIPIF